MKKYNRGLLWILAAGMLVFSNGCRYVEGTVTKVKKSVGAFEKETQVPKQTLEPVAETDGIHQEYYFKQLAMNEKRSYRQLLEGILDFETEISLSDTDNDAIDKAYRALLKDHQELFWVHNGETYYKTINKSDTIFTPSYGYTREEAAPVEESLEQAYQQVLQALPENAAAYDIVRSVYDYVIGRTDYVMNENDQNIAGVFSLGQAVCAGYAGAVQYLLERFDIESIYVSGETKMSSEGHAWNIVNIDGNYYYVDATNGDQPGLLGLEGAVPLYDYLAPFPNEYSQICWPDEEFALPVCSAVDYNYYVLNGNCFSSYEWETLYNYFTAQLSQGAHLLRVKFTDPASYQAAYTDMIENGRIEELVRYYMNLQGIPQVEYHYSNMDDLLTLYVML
ncbi:MAG: transglutaminase-like superfamily [Lachnospiraceae bacterium]|nr:transglutaminase-like superfamily [Lachnospiraceae bacterium]